MPLPVRTERRLLQTLIAVGGFVPVGGGLAGALLGDAMLGGAHGDPDLDSHVRYLSGLLLGIGRAYWEAIPTIERRTDRIRLLTLIVLLAGLIRVTGILFVAVPSVPMILTPGMELVVTPLICLWQARVARRCGLLVPS